MMPKGAVQEIQERDAVSPGMGGKVSMGKMNARGDGSGLKKASPYTP